MSDLDPNTPAPTVKGSINPDAQTVERIRNLAIVGKALTQRSSDTSFQTEFYLAKEALNKFSEGIDRLNLDEESHRGMDELVKYLQMKIDKRLDSNVHMTPLE